MSEVTSPDFEAIKTKQQATWGTGNYAAIATQVQLASDLLCETAGVRAGSRLLDVACGSGNASIAAARRGCEVTGIDYVPSLLERARIRTEAEGFEAEYIEADAEQLPLEDGSFDTVLSVFGVMFTPNQERTAAELVRVCRPGGMIAVANWTPTGFIGGIFKIIGSHVPPPAGLRSPLEWGTEERVTELYGDAASKVWSNEQDRDVQVPLARALRRCLPHVLRADSQGVRGARRGRAGGAEQRSARAHPRERPSRGHGHDRGAVDLPRGRRNPSVGVVRRQPESDRRRGDACVARTSRTNLGGATTGRCKTRPD